MWRSCKHCWPGPSARSQQHTSPPSGTENVVGKQDCVRDLSSLGFSDVLDFGRLWGTCIFYDTRSASWKAVSLIFTWTASCLVLGKLADSWEPRMQLARERQGPAPLFQALVPQGGCVLCTLVQFGRRGGRWWPGHRGGHRTEHGAGAPLVVCHMYHDLADSSGFGEAMKHNVRTYQARSPCGS